MNDIKVGEYIRTNDGIVSKLKRIEFDKNDTSLKWYVFDKKEYGINIIKESYINKPYIKSHSKNIIDLIEVGDYVNGTKVYSIGLTIVDELPIVNLEDGRSILSVNSIVTKEQFNSIKYVLGGKEE